MSIALRLIISFLIFLVSIYFTFVFEDDYRDLIRWFYKHVSDYKISFFQPRKHIYFTSSYFILSVALFIIIVFNLAMTQKKIQIVVNILISILSFVLSIYAYSYFDSKMILNECKECINGFKQLNFEEVNYDKIMMISLLISIIPWFKHMNLPKINKVY